MFTQDILYYHEQLKNKIAADCNRFLKENFRNIRKEEIIVNVTPKLLLSVLSNVLELRNVTAHNNKILNHKCKKNIKFHKDLFLYYGVSNHVPRQSLYHTFLCLQILLSPQEYAQLNNSIRKRFNVLENKLKSISIDVILSSLGFPKNWHNLPKLGQ